ncbi:MAG: sensor histidine kinase [Actinomycetota bacterium]
MRRAAFWIALVVAAALVVVALWLGTLNGTFSGDPFTLLIVLSVATYTITGAVLARRVPHNPIGWLFLVVGLGLLFGGATAEYATYTITTNPGALPAGDWAAWVNNWTFVIAGLIPIVLILFPTGRVPSPRWRWLVWTIVATLVCLVLGAMFRPTPIELNQGLTVANPTGIESLRTVLSAGAWIFGILLAAESIAAVAALVVRYRRAGEEERQQVRWIAVSAALAGVFLILVLITSIGLQPGQSRFVNDLAFLLFFLCLSIGIPGAVAVALLKYHLFDLDLVVKKTVLYVTVAGMLLVAFVAAAVLVGGVFGRSQRAAVIAAAAIGIAFWPALRIARRIADTIVYGGRATPYEVLTTFGRRMSETYATDDVVDRAAQLLASATGASAATVWIRVGREIRPAATWPPDRAAGSALPLDDDDLPMLPADWAEPVRDRGELLGALAVTMPANDPIGPGRQRLIRDLADQAGLALRNVRLIEELRASRQRLVAAQDEGRRRLERNIHDGVQQQLVALAVKLRLADGMLERDPVRAHVAITALQDDANAALEDLRDLARGIYPPLLADQGLRAALEAQARKATTPVSVDASTIGRYPRDIESTVYFCALEAMNNIAKYAAARTASVSVEQTDGLLRFTVHDDGRGFDPRAVIAGTGLQGMSDRLEAVGGTLRIESAIGVGTTVIGTVPVGSDQAEAASQAASSRSGPNDDLGM